MTHELSLVFMTSLIGSWHCAAMCGAFSVISCGGTKSVFRLAAYQLGRLSSYFILVSLVYLFASPIQTLIRAYNVQWLSALVMVLLLVLWLYLLLIGPRHLSKPPEISVKALKRIKQTSGSTFSYLIGLSTTLLPCIWLYGFVGLAAARDSYGESLVLITAFWVGTLPSLLLVQFFSLRINKNIRQFLKPFAIVLLLAVASWNLFFRLQNNATHASDKIKPGASCHHPEKQ